MDGCNGIDVMNGNVGNDGIAGAGVMTLYMEMKEMTY